MNKASATSFSLVLATLGRTAELGRFLAALDAQTARGFELIVVDQNGDDRLLPVLAPFRGRFPIRHLTSAPGLSRARNVALPHAAGDVVAFPDDDCLYPADLLERTARFFQTHSDTHGIVVRPLGDDGATLLEYRDEPATVSRLNLFGRAISYTLFVRREVVEAVGGFDETLGLGAATPWGAGEDIDYPLRALEAGFRLAYVPELAVVHPLHGGPERTLQRAFPYAAGFGRVCRKHGFPAWYMGYHLCRSLAGVLAGVSTGRPHKARVHWRALRGKLHGWRAP
ncbi:MAG: Glycosyltransferase [uncultured Gemmatimonadetes bacterium]|uniref:Glycosyltransferase n=1 Tax=uncultured Gemmatimonadota bacterium TaxID=203437 RepID=A0A6J4KW67_9BACT|nr:MAG: Glycosyltransferase [uncultured Gemmatimonadota bacterium]